VLEQHIEFLHVIGSVADLIIELRVELNALVLCHRAIVMARLIQGKWKDVLADCAAWVLLLGLVVLEVFVE